MQILKQRKEITNELQSNNCEVDIYDPWVSANEAESEYGIKLISTLNKETYDGIILAVAHKEFKNLRISNKKITRRTATHTASGKSSEHLWIPGKTEDLIGENIMYLSFKNA